MRRPMPTAFFALFLAHPLESGDGNAEKLNNDAGVDVGLDAQCEDGSGGERAAGHDVIQAQDRVLQLLEVILKCCYIDKRYRDRIAESVQKDDQDREEDLLAQFLDRPGT